MFIWELDNRAPKEQKAKSKETNRCAWERESEISLVHSMPVYQAKLEGFNEAQCVRKSSSGNMYWNHPRKLSFRMQSRYNGEMPDASSQQTPQGPSGEMLQKLRAISLLLSLEEPFLSPEISSSFHLLSEEE